MTENELRAKVVSIAKQYLGCKESDGSHRKIIDGYNAVKPLARGYAVKYTDAWCATYVSFVGIKAGLTDIIFRECGCGAMIDLYKKVGRWVENDAYVPKIGDIVMYSWYDNGYGDCTIYPDHVGIVASISGKTMKIIEGNINNSVGYRTLSVNGRYIRGYCIPNYASKATSSAASTSSSSTTTSNSLSKTVKWYGFVDGVNSGLNVRTWAGTKNSKCSFSPLKKGTIVGICDSKADSNGAVWYYIKYNGQYGFVHYKYIKEKSTTSTLCPIDTLAKNKVINTPSYWHGAQNKLQYLNGLLYNLSKRAGKNKLWEINNVKDAIDYLAFCKVISSPDYWKKNYSKVQYLDSLLIKASNNIPYKVKVTASTLNVRSGAGAGYSIKGTVKKDEVYEIVKVADGKGATKWLKLGNGNGWIASDYVKYSN